MSLQDMVSGQHIHNEFDDLRVDGQSLKQIIEDSTADVRQIHGLHPNLFIGYGGQGKSSSVNQCINVLGGSKDGRRAKIGHRGPETKDVELYACKHETSAGPGEVLFLDTEGFEPGGRQRILTNCETEILKRGVTREVFLHRLVFVLVIGANAQGQRLAGSSELTQVISAITSQFCVGGDQVKPRMLVVLTHSDNMHQDQRQGVYDDCKSIIDRAVGSKMTVDPPLFVSGVTGDGFPTLVQRLTTIAEASLHSPELLQVTRRLLAERLVAEVRHWSSQPSNRCLESDGTWARRCCFSIARLYGARLSRFKEEPTWRDVDRLRVQLARWHRTEPLEQSERFHEDNLRLASMKVRCSSSVQTEAGSTSSWTSAGSSMASTPDKAEEPACSAPSHAESWWVQAPLSF